MKMRISQLRANPYKQMVAGGKLVQEQVDAIKANLTTLGFMGALPVIKIGDNYHIVSGHHRVEAVKQNFGDVEIEVTLHEYNEDNLFRGMIIENLTQSGKEWDVEHGNIIAVFDYLNNNPESLNQIRGSISRPATGRHMPQRMNIEYQNNATSTDVIAFLGGEKVASKTQVNSHKQMEANLTPEIKERVKFGHRGERDKGNDVILATQATILALDYFKDKPEEQNDIARALKNSREQRVREQGKLLTIYQKAPEEEKQRIRSGQIDIADVSEERVTISPDMKTTNDRVDKIIDMVDELMQEIRTFTRMGEVQRMTIAQNKRIQKSLLIDFKFTLSPFIKMLQKNVIIKPREEAQ